MTYKAKSITGAEARVRQLQAIVAKYEEICTRLENENKLLAKLAADGPAFFNPLEALAAKQVRNAILARLGMNPDGTFTSEPKVKLTIAG